MFLPGASFEMDFTGDGLASPGRQDQGTLQLLKLALPPKTKRNEYSVLLSFI